ncbi:hypothetical protein DHD05_00990 [Arenibacter sp. N53]|uniref:hybrid sensor histidine kinase/response regulator transcription factor n=1 Tax=Arenibacter TaxID=178469 RepID=UPI000CD3FB98|nr:MULTISPECIES: ATP-binding protein [Arenibacter]MCM4150151.1 hypothetical protein [Arenibacter sp. N53]
MKAFILPLCLLLTSLLLSQRNEDTFELGFFSVKNYSHEDYQAHHQNWFITQDREGLIYAANGEGILEYDGATWRFITSPGLNAVRAVVVDGNNTKWVGGDREMGYLESDSLGFLVYRSLAAKIPSTHPLNATVWRIFPDVGRILFVSDDEIYSWQDDEMKIIPHPGVIHREFQVNGKVYIRISDQGIYELQGDSLELIPSGTFFKDLKVLVALPYKRDMVLFATRSAGLFIYTGKEILKMESEIDQYLKENLLYAGQQMPDSTYAFATLKGGVVLMDRYGKRIGTITEDEGILNNQVHGMVVDNRKALWLALQTGISKIEPHLPYVFYDKRLGLEGTVSAITSYKGELYVGTYNGLFKLGQNMENRSLEFKRIEEIGTGCFSLLSLGNELLAGTADGTFLISDNTVTKIAHLPGTRVLHQSTTDPNRVFAGQMYGLSTIYNKNGQWQKEMDIDQIVEDIKYIDEDNSGAIWLGTTLNKVIKLTFPISVSPAELSLVEIKVHRYQDGLPEGPINMYLIENEILVTSNGASGPLFKLNVDSELFLPEAHFGKKFGLDSLYLYPRAYQKNGGHVILESNPVEGRRYRFSASPIGHGQYSVSRIYDERFRSTTEFNAFWDSDNVLWLGGEEITKYDLKSTFDFQLPFKTHIRQVTLGQDSAIFGGSSNIALRPQLKYSNNSLRFEFAAMSSEENKYQYQLVGFDEKWSEWSNETKKDYTNLREGDYLFRARAHDIYGGLSAAGSFYFEILPPWYRTWVAYLFYLLAFIIFLWAMLKLRSRQLKAKNIALEKLIALRTSEVRHQANQLKVQAEKLQELDKAKSRFFANISHEFRTPLTLIKGPIENLEKNFNQKLNIETVKMIRRNTNRLLHMVNQLLDLSKIDDGSLKLSPTEGDIFKCLRAATSSFNSLAAQRDMDYRVEIPSTVLWASFDRDKLENIVYNLLGNAFKFSEDGSDIAFAAEYSEQRLQFKVSDSGKGIPKEQLPFIFDRFYQVDNSTTKEKEGSGIGLSLSKDLVELMEGTITVSSDENKGTYFIVRLPLQKIRITSKKAEELKLENEIFELSPRTYELVSSDNRDMPNILLVEDNPDMRNYIKGQLSPLYKVKEAVNGELGLQLAIKNPPDLIITDLMMPKMDGIELCRKLKTHLNTSHIPVIMLTAKAGMDNKIEGLETGADDYLTKPFDGKELLVRIKNLINQRQKLRELFTNKEVQIDPKKVTVTSIDQKFLEDVLSLLEQKFADSSFGVPQMQGALAMSKTQLHRKLKALTNEAPGELLRNFRLKRAAQLLLQKADSVTQIAYRVGFNNLSYFAKCFKELYGVPPSAY